MISAMKAMKELIRLATGAISAIIVFGSYYQFRMCFHFGPLGSMGPEERAELEATEEEASQLDDLVTNVSWEHIPGYHKTPWFHALLLSCVRLITGNLGPSR